MNSLLNTVIVLLLLGWLLGFFGFRETVGNLIHILLVLAVVAVIYRLITGKSI